jgi:hypothetical protein
MNTVIILIAVYGVCLVLALIKKKEKPKSLKQQLRERTEAYFGPEVASHLSNNSNKEL